MTILRFFILLTCLPTFHSFSILLSHREFTLTTSYVSPYTTKHDASSHRNISLHLNASSKEKNWLMEDFRTADGKIIDPYLTLKLGRDASRTEIRNTYRNLSKKYHPDAVRYRTIMPGNCDTLEDVRDEWERIKLSYEILSDKKLRLKYDRQSALNDPGKAIGRAAFDTVGWGVTLLVKGVFSIGKHAFAAATSPEAPETNIQKDEKVSSIVKLDARIKRKERMVQHIQLKSNVSGGNNVNFLDSFQQCP